MCTPPALDRYVQTGLKKRNTRGLVNLAGVLTADEGAGAGRVDALDEGLVLKNAPGHGADPAEHGGRQADAVFALCVFLL